jgi:hypothetical protein
MDCQQQIQGEETKSPSPTFSGQEISTDQPSFSPPTLLMLAVQLMLSVLFLFQPLSALSGALLAALKSLQLLLLPTALLTALYAMCIVDSASHPPSKHHRIKLVVCVLFVILASLAVDTSIHAGGTARERTDELMHPTCGYCTDSNPNGYHSNANGYLNNNGDNNCDYEHTCWVCPYSDYTDTQEVPRHTPSTMLRCAHFALESVLHGTREETSRGACHNSSQIISSGSIAADQTQYFSYATHCTDHFFGYTTHCTFYHFFGYTTHCTIEEETDYDHAYKAFITAKFDYQYMLDTAALSVLLLVAALVLCRFLFSKRSNQRALSASVAIYLLCVFPVVAKAAGPARNVMATCKSICCNLVVCNSTFPKTCSTPCCGSYITDPVTCAGCLTAHGCTSPPTPAPPGPAPPKPGHSNECALLCDTYKSTFKGDGWIASCKGGWATGCKTATPTTSCCGWHGITCNEAGHIVKIALGGCNLLGTLAVNAAGQSIFSLPALAEFGVENGGDGAKCAENKGIGGRLPADLQNASMLRSIGMYCNSFTGTLSALISPKLETADLHHNSFTGTLPGFLHCASTLTYVSLANNQLTGTVPASWKALSKLETVGLAYNKLSGGIDWLITKAMLPALTVCFIRDNEFTGTIGGKLPLQLAVFDADHNKFSAIDPAICTSPVPAFGKAGGCASDWPNQPFGTCCLSQNTIYCNSTTSLPSCVVKNCGAECAICTGKSTDLAAVECAVWKDFYDATNGPKWSDCSDARSDPCSCNWAVHDVEVGCKGGHITYMHLVENNLRGTIPSSLAKLSEMTELDLSENSLTGLVPSLPFAQYTRGHVGCHLDYPSDQGGCTEPDCNHFKCPLPAGSEQCKWGRTTPGVHCK